MRKLSEENTAAASRQLLGLGELQRVATRVTQMWRWWSSVVFVIVVVLYCEEKSAISTKVGHT